MGRASAVAALGAAALAVAAPARAILDAELVVGNLEFCLYVTWAPGDPDRMFVLDRLGRIYVFADGAFLPTPFLDISGETLPDYAEQGLLGMAFHPDYSSNGRFYVYFIKGTPGAGGAGVSTVRRYQVSADPDVADASSGQLVFQVAQPGTNHNGGTILFGPDGYLYLALGDGGGGGPASQSLATVLGKMLRFDVDGDDFPADSTRNYAIPPDNPFVGDPSARPEVWSRGFRNPYRFSFDRSTGDLWIGDVGHHAFEEIDFQPASSPGGENWGWNLMEGFSCFDPPTDCNDGSLALPVHDYPHATEGCYSVTGGVVYRGTALGPAFQGTYFFADFCDTEIPAFTGRIYSFRYEGGEKTDFTEWTADLDPPGSERLIFPGTIAEDPDGELYVVEYRASLGQIWKIVPEPGLASAPVPARGAAALDLGPGAPNPSRADVRWEVSFRPGVRFDARIVDASGRSVRRLVPQPSGDRATIVWDGRDGAGRPASAGVYFLRVDAGGERRTDRVTRLR